MLFCGPTTGAQAQQPAPPPRPNWSAPASEAPQAGPQTPGAQKPGDESQAAQGKTPAGDIQLAAYDAIYIPKTGVADVYTAYNQYFKQFLPSYGIGYSLNGF